MAQFEEDEDEYVILITDQAYPQVFEFQEITLYETAILIRELKPSSSCGVDGLTARLIKAAGPSIILPLCHVINLCISQSHMPSMLKIGCITPLFKDGNKSDPSNYHPISVLPVLGTSLNV